MTKAPSQGGDVDSKSAELGSSPGGAAIGGPKIRHYHRWGFRPGEWATIICIVEVRDRECFLVRFPDGKTDFWVMDDPSCKYEFVGFE